MNTFTNAVDTKHEKEIPQVHRSLVMYTLEYSPRSLWLCLARMGLGLGAWLMITSSLAFAQDDAPEKTIASQAAAVPRDAHEKGVFVQASLSGYDESQELLDDQGDTMARSSRSLLLSDLTVGYRLPLPSAFFVAGFPLVSLSELGFGLVYHPGDFPLIARQTVVYTPHITKHVAVEVGPMLGARVNFENPFSHAMVGLHAAVAWKGLALALRPHFTVPIGQRERDTFGGRLQNEVETTFVPLDLSLRYTF